VPVDWTEAKHMKAVFLQLRHPVGQMVVIIAVMIVLFAFNLFYFCEGPSTLAMLFAIVAQ
jgi:hypothetical protein